MLSPRETPPRPLALQPLPASLLDLRNPDTRQQLGWLARYGRTAHQDPEHSLFYRCWPGVDDSYTLRWTSFPNNFAVYVEVQRNPGDPEATVLRWRDTGALPPPPGYTDTAPPSPAPPPVRFSVSAADFSAIESAFLALAHDRVEPIRSYDAFDGGGVVLEFCRGGQYSVFARVNYFGGPDDQRVLDLGRQMLALGRVVVEATGP